jgi:hypothetical protein
VRHMQRTYLGVEVIFLHNWSYEYACVMQSVRPPLVNSERSDTQQGNTQKCCFNTIRAIRFKVQNNGGNRW